MWLTNQGARLLTATLQTCFLLVVGLKPIAICECTPEDAEAQAKIDNYHRFDKDGKQVFQLVYVGMQWICAGQLCKGPVVMPLPSMSSRVRYRTVILEPAEQEVPELLGASESVNAKYDM